VSGQLEGRGLAQVGWLGRTSKLNAQSRTDAVMKATRLGLIIL
jgi:hypothetical protein